ncbi:MULTISPECIES: pseudouridine synthase [unclassified Aureimonas]|uniref:pseudouridine synthase n=1 Tax=unclassified Aureimonas TaxID=2615206 RepID=UPI0006FEF438|nr:MULTISPECIES: pseudouridine synthase [unclassified Aureimonas]KQT61279.1 16S rRNA pseudouridine(516) synthase [Aureimonas sp. Leaf460]KQT68728.1 16S rRNA pseudouridine(516) synthase [Aureimonas sp. Leaf427]
MKPASPVRLDKLLANLGYGSRREIGLLAKAGRITLDGAAVPSGETKIRPDPDLPRRMIVDGEAVDPPPGLALLLHKPLGVTCSHKEAGPLVYGLLPTRWRRRDPAISTIGRLDKETSGLLLMTDDGALLHRVISPKMHVPKRYLATLARPLRGDEAEIFASGTLMLDGEEKPLLPAMLEILSPTSAHLTLTEGRYHQVRRMFAAVGNHVEALHRDRMGRLGLGTLEPGAFRLLDESDLALVLPPREG